MLSHVINMADRQPEVVRAEGQHGVVDRSLQVTVSILAYILSPEMEYKPMFCRRCSTGICKLQAAAVKVPAVDISGTMM